MHISFVTFLIVCPLVFIAGFVDSIAGGGGIISLPAYLLAGLPMHFALATNKMSSFCGTSMATIRYIKHKCYRRELAIPTVAAALAGSTVGAHLVLLTADKYLRYLLLIVLPIVAIVVFVRGKTVTADSDGFRPINTVRFSITVVISFCIGMYDGFYGPGTGTFLMLVFTAIAGLNARQAAGNTKFVNWASNAAAFATFAAGGRVIYTLGVAAAVCSILGNYAGSGFVIRDGSKFIRPVIIVVLVLLFVKILAGK